MIIESKLTNNNKIFEVLKSYYSINSYINNSDIPISNIYVFIGSIDAKTSPEQTQKYYKDVYKNIFAVKKINSNDFCPVVERVDWQYNTNYYQYDDSENLYARDSNDKLVNKFYVKNSYDQIFICVNNNNNSFSTIEPILEPGNYTFNNIISLSDGYKWKYIYTINQSSKIKFFNSDWMPIKNFNSNFDTTKKYCGFGGIEVINVDNVGNNYPNGINTITVNIDGDGYDANAYTIVIDNKLSDVIVSNTGYNYSHANITFNSIVGNNASANCIISPIGGFGFNILSDLGCNSLAINVELDDSLPTDLTYYQLGLIINPLDSESNFAEESFYWTTTNIIVSPGSENFIEGEYVFQGSSLEDSTYSAKILKYDVENNILYLINNKGNIQNQQLIKGKSSNISRVVLLNNKPQFQLFSGYITFIENTSGIFRSVDSKEQLNLILKY